MPRHSLHLPTFCTTATSASCCSLRIFGAMALQAQAVIAGWQIYSLTQRSVHAGAHRPHRSRCPRIWRARSLPGTSSTSRGRTAYLSLHRASCSINMLGLYLVAGGLVMHAAWAGAVDLHGHIYLRRRAQLRHACLLCAAVADRHAPANVVVVVLADRAASIPQASLARRWPAYSTALAARALRGYCRSRSWSSSASSSC